MSDKIRIIFKCYATAHVLHADMNSSTPNDVQERLNLTGDGSTLSNYEELV